MDGRAARAENVLRQALEEAGQRDRAAAEAAAAAEAERDSLLSEAPAPTFFAEQKLW